MGFRNEIKKILKFLPSSQKRQTLLFSATIPPELKTIMADNMKKDFVEVDCINDDAADSSTHIKVDQTHVVMPDRGMEAYVQTVVDVVLHALDDDEEENHKVVVFFPTARMVAFFATFFNEGLNIPVIELHSKKSQSYRNNASNKFRNADKGVLFTSDVSARGVDYPNVSQVIQVRCCWKLPWNESIIGLEGTRFCLCRLLTLSSIVHTTVVWSSRKQRTVHSSSRSYWSRRKGWKRFDCTHFL